MKLTQLNLFVASMVLTFGMLLVFTVAAQEQSAPEQSKEAEPAPFLHGPIPAHEPDKSSEIDPEFRLLIIRGEDIQRYDPPAKEKSPYVEEETTEEEGATDEAPAESDEPAPEETPADGGANAGGESKPEKKAKDEFVPVTIDVVIAYTLGEREIGLMYVEKMGKDHGMFFVHDRPTTLTYWMKDTLIPLDIAFVDKDGMIINIETMRPETLDVHKSVLDAQYALEVNAGWFKAHKVRPGDMIKDLPELRKYIEEKEEKRKPVKHRMK